MPPGSVNMGHGQHQKTMTLLKDSTTPSPPVITFKNGCYGITPANCLLCGREASSESNSSAVATRDVKYYEGRKMSLNASSLEQSDNLSPRDQTQHVYSPVCDAKKEIRIFVLDPGPPSSPIFGRFIKAILGSEDQLIYEALSYTWADENGDREYSAYVWCDTGYVPVTKNGEATLRRVRMRTKARLIWMDQLCIHQADVSERSHQVGLMSEIDGNASQVLIYLGSSITDNIILPNLHHDLKKPSALESEWCQSLLRLPWFTRIWVLQEVARARKAVMLGENTCGSFSSIRNGFRFAQLVKTLEGQICDPLPGALSIEPRKPVPATEILQLLINTNACHATEPRDKVFAFFGIVDSAQEHGLIADYMMDTEEVYTGITLHIIKSSRKLDVLAYYSGEKNVLSLPSWVPDWSAKRREPLIKYVKHFFDGTKLDTLLGGVQARVSCPAGSRNLFVRGRCLAFVESRWETDTHGRLPSWRFRCPNSGNWTSCAYGALEIGANVFTTDKEPGFGAREVHEGDQIWHLDGAEQLFALRKFGRAFEVVGEFFLPGLFPHDHGPDSFFCELDGEIYQDLEAQEVQLC